MVAQFYAGSMLQEGKGTQESAEDAVQRFLSSANQGYVYSQLKLAWAYEDGFGVPQDLELAFYWRMAAANQGNARAQFHISQAYARGQGVMVEWILVANTSIQAPRRLSAHQEAIASTTKSAAIAALPATPPSIDTCDGASIAR